MKPLKLTKGQAQQAVGLVRAQLRNRMGFVLHVEDAPSHAALRDALVARLQGLTPRDECSCGGLLGLDGHCLDCNRVAP